MLVFDVSWKLSIVWTHFFLWFCKHFFLCVNEKYIDFDCEPLEAIETHSFGLNSINVNYINVLFNLLNCFLKATEIYIFFSPFTLYFKLQVCSVFQRITFWIFSFPIHIYYICRFIVTYSWFTFYLYIIRLFISFQFSSNLVFDVHEKRKTLSFRKN